MSKSQTTVRWQSEFTVPADDRDGTAGIKFEDNGQAAVMYYESDDGKVVTVGDDHCFFVRLQSWDERLVPDDKKAEFVPQHYNVAHPPANVRGYVYEVPEYGIHPLFRSLMGKKVRITIETIDDEKDIR